MGARPAGRLGDVSEPPVPAACDHFEDDQPNGTVIGTRSPEGAVRLGRDAEGALSIDHGALRIRYLRDPGWGRASIAYGPFTPEPGLAMAVSILNGLSTSQTSPLPEGRREMLRRLRRTFPSARLQPPKLRQNLAVGWFGSAVPADPTARGWCVVAAAGANATGELEAHGGGRGARVVESVQNVPIVYVLVTRERDVVLYASSLPGTHGFPAYPRMRPMAVLAHGDATQPLYAGIHQSVLGEVKYRLDSRIYAVRVALVPELALGAGGAEVGSSDGFATLAEGRPDAPSGLVRLVVRTGPTAGSVTLSFRGAPDGRCWRVELGPGGATLAVDDDQRDEIACRQGAPLRPRTEHDLQVVDDGATVAVCLDGVLLFDRVVTDSRLGDEHGVGHSPAPDGGEIVAFEAHPRDLPVPASLDVGLPSLPGPGVAADDVVDAAVDPFEGADGDLAGSPTLPLGLSWQRSMGTGSIVRTGSGTARVLADLDHPNPGRTIYTVPWNNPRFADVAVTIVPPGARRGEGHRCRSGLVLWQDDGNHLVLNDFLDDGSVGISISAFLRIGGHEAMYDNDAVWTNIGDRVRQGVPHRLRVVFDGERFTAFVDDELVLYRALTDYRPDAARLTVRGVGLVANWEWGDDTGTVFDDFVARGVPVD